MIRLGRFLGMVVVVQLLLGVLGLSTEDPSPSAQAPTTVPPTTATTAAAPAPAPPTTASTAPRARPTVPAATTTTDPAWPVLLVSGRIVDESGRGIPNADLLFGKRVGLFDALPSMFGGMFGGCEGPTAPVECRWMTVGTTGPDGSYTLRFRLTLAEARSVGALALKVTWPGVSTADVPVSLDSDPHRIPDVTMWRPDLGVTEGRATWRPYPREDARYRFSVLGGGPFGDDELVAVDKASPTGTAFEHRLLEDLAKTATVTATVVGEVHASLPSALQGPGPPPTRDRPCQVVPDDSSRPPKDHATCPITRAVTRERLAGPPESHQVVVDLGTSRTLSLAAVWTSADFTVDVSEDGTTWFELADSDGALEPTPDVQLAYARTPTSGRYVRLRLPERGFGLFFVDRLAVW